MRSRYKLLNWAQMPLLKPVTFLIIGILLADYFRFYNHFLFFITGVGILIFVGVSHNIQSVNTRTKFGSAVGLFLLMTMVGYCLYIFNIPKYNTSHFEHYISKKDNVTALVVDDLKFKNSSSYVVNVFSVDGNETKGRLKLFFDKGEGRLGYKKGDLIALSISIRKNKKKSNPRTFDFTRYNYYQGINHIGFVPKGEHKLLLHYGLPWYTELTDSLRVIAVNILKEYLSDDSQLSIAVAMILGDKDQINKDTYSAFSNTGAVHVLAVSGLHVGILTWLLVVLFKRLKTQSNWIKGFKMFILLIVVWTFAMVTGASPAVLRASTMFSILWVGKLWMNGSNVYNLLALSAIILLCYNPYLLFHLGFQFSYLALISILFFQPKIQMLLSPSSYMGVYLWKLVSVSIAAQILIFPLSVFYFNQFPTVFIFSGIAAVMMATLILSFGISLLFLSWVPIVSNVLGALLSWSLCILIESIEFLDKLPLQKIDGLYFSNATVILFYVFIAAFMFFISRWTKDYLDRIITPKRKTYSFSMLTMLFSLIGMMCITTLYSFSIKSSQKFVVYDVRNGSIIDIFKNGNLKTIQSTHMDTESIDYITKGMRTYHGSPSSSPMDLISGCLVVDDKVVFLPSLMKERKLIPSKSDFMILSYPLDISVYDLLSAHVTNSVIMDSSIDSYRQVSSWKKRCQELNIPFHYTKEDGAFVFSD